MKRILLLALILSANLYPMPASGTPPFELPEEGTGNTQIKEDCNTAGYLNDQTKVTFYGDSRMDLANSPGYGSASMDFYLGVKDQGWNVQNFGMAGYDSYDLRQHFIDCFSTLEGRKKPDYWIADKIVYHQGGNDFVHNILWIELFPTLLPKVIDGAMYDIEKSISMFYRRKKKILMVGNYPAISCSVAEGATVDWQYAGIARYEAYWMQGEEDDNILLQLKNKLNEVFPNNGFEEAPEIEDQNISEIVKSSATVVSYGMLRLEPKIKDMVTRRKSYGVDIEYLRMWESFMYRADEPWVANPHLYADYIHPGPLGFTLWGGLVGEKIRAMGWHTDPNGGVVNPTPDPITDPDNPQPPANDDDQETSGGEDTGNDFDFWTWWNSLTPLEQYLYCIGAGICGAP